MSPTLDTFPRFLFNVSTSINPFNTFELSVINNVSTRYKKRGKVSSVGDILNKHVFYVKKSAYLRDTLQRILKRGLKYVPVVDEQNVLFINDRHVFQPAF